MEEKELGILFLASGDGSSILRGKETKPTQNANGHRRTIGKEKMKDVIEQVQRSNWFDLCRV
jgi:hypothetical protein